MSLLYRIIVVATLCGVAGAAAGPPEVRFEGAVHDPEGGEIRFANIQPIDWKQLARRHVTEVNVDRPTPTQVRELSRRVNEVALVTEIRFGASLEEAPQPGYNYLISPRGIELIEPHRLEGSADFKFNYARTQIVRTAFHGQVVAQTARDRVTDGGFVMHSASTVTVQMVPSARCYRGWVSA